MKFIARAKNQSKKSQKYLIFFAWFIVILALILIISWPWIFSSTWQLALGQLLSHLLIVVSLGVVFSVVPAILKIYLGNKEKANLKFNYYTLKKVITNQLLFYVCLAYLWPGNLVYLYRWPNLIAKFSQVAYWQNLLLLGLFIYLAVTFWWLKNWFLDKKQRLQWQIWFYQCQKVIFGKLLVGLNKFISRIKENLIWLIVFGFFFYLAKLNFDTHLAWKNPVERWQAISSTLEDDWQAWQNYALALEEQGQTSSAINVYLKIYQHQLGNAELLTKIGDLFASQGNLITADYYYLKAQRLKIYDQEIIKRREHLRVLIH